ncbi:acyl carrier protein [Actinoplanes sp. NPDC020271]|uniref:acyl carrier protein n=1 Tax=Actinoplanes sp. NPDC020271 TaxID=3363896 RepID=UPI0037B69150
MSATAVARIQSELQEWLCRHLAAQLRLPYESIDPAERMSAYGLDSVRAVAVLVETEEYAGFPIDPEALWDYPTVETFARFLAEQMADRPEYSEKLNG